MQLVNKYLISNGKYAGNNLNHLSPIDIKDMNTYLLLKDLPNVNKGTEIVEDVMMGYKCIDKYGTVARFNKTLIEQHPIWFLKRIPAPQPPLGLSPEWLHKEKRLTEIREAIGRYVEAKYPVPLSWVTEEYLLVIWLTENKKP